MTRWVQPGKRYRGPACATPMRAAGVAGSGERASFQPEHGDRVFQQRRLGPQRFRGRRGLFDERGVLLRRLVHLRDRDVDLLEAVMLLLRGGPQIVVINAPWYLDASVPEHDRLSGRPRAPGPLAPT